MPNWTLTIDFGTSYSTGVIASGDQYDPIEIDGSTRVPTIVMLTDSGELMVGAPAERQLALSPHRVERSLKRRLGDPVILLAGQPVRPVDGVAAMLRRIGHEALRLRNGEQPSEVRLTVPARWGERRRNVLREAARLAGLGEVVLIAEPVAAAVYLTDHGRQQSGYVAVYDLGGGTFDTAVLRRLDDGFEVLGTPGGNERLGGDDFDERLYQHLGDRLAEIDDEMWEQLRFADDRAWRRANQELNTEVRRAKEALSLNSEYTVYIGMPVDVELRVTRDEFEALIVGDVERSVDELVATISRSGISTDEIESVCLVGGSSRIPLVARLVAARLGTVPETWGDPKLATVLGAARATNVAIHASRTPTVPVSTEPVATAPVSTQPVATVPVSTEPVATAPVSTVPVPTQPVATVPVSTEPSQDDIESPVEPVQSGPRAAATARIGHEAHGDAAEANDARPAVPAPATFSEQPRSDGQTTVTVLASAAAGRGASSDAGPASGKGSSRRPKVLVRVAGALVVVLGLLALVVVSIRREASPSAATEPSTSSAVTSPVDPVTSSDPSNIPGVTARRTWSIVAAPIETTRSSTSAASTSPAKGLLIEVKVELVNDTADPVTGSHLEVVPKQLAADVGALTFEPEPDAIVNTDPVVAYDVELPPGAKFSFSYRATVEDESSDTLLSELSDAQRRAEDESPEFRDAIDAASDSPVPDVVDLDATEATRQLEEAGFVVVRVELPNDKFGPGTVLEMLPEEGTALPRGSSVSITVAVATALTDVPSVVGLTREWAIAALGTKGLLLGTVTERTVTAQADNGVVLEQGRRVGTRLPEGSSVDVTIGVLRTSGTATTTGGTGTTTPSATTATTAATTTTTTPTPPPPPPPVEESPVNTCGSTSRTLPAGSTSVTINLQSCFVDANGNIELLDLQAAGAGTLTRCGKFCVQYSVPSPNGLPVQDQFIAVAVDTAGNRSTPLTVYVCVFC